MSSNRNISNDFFAAVSIGAEHELREILNVEGQEITIDAAKSYNEQGETPLLVAIRRNHFDVVKFLVDELKVDIGQNGRFWWKGLDHSEVPPLFAAILSGQAIIVDYLIFAENLISLPSIAMSSITSSSISRQEKIDALELIGSAYIFCGEVTARKFGLPCWVQAMILRQSTTGGEPEMPKNLRHSSELVRKAMGGAVEVNTLEQLMRLFTTEPHMQLMTQANMVNNRILQKISPGSNFLTCTRLLKYGKDYWSGNEYGRVVNIAMLILELIDLNDDDQNWDRMNVIINNTFNILSKSFSMLRRETANTNVREELSFANLMKVVEFSFAHCRSRTNELFQARTTEDMNEWSFWPKNYIGDFIVLLHNMDLSQQENDLFRQSVAHFISLDHRIYLRRNLLHMICLMSPVPIDVIQLLLELGADPNATDEEGHTSLHLLVKNHSEHVNTNAVRLLMDFGGHLDQANKFGTTVLERLKYRMRHLLRMGVYDPNLKSLINNMLPLSCCSARVIRQNRIDIRALPHSLQGFVRRH